MRIKLATTVLCIVALIFAGCAASMHPGAVTVSKPPMDEKTEAIWFNYWQDQLDAYKGDVIAPTSDYPDVAKQAYQRAKVDWDTKVQAAEGKTWLVGLGIGAVAAVGLFFTLMSAASD